MVRQQLKTDARDTLPRALSSTMQECVDPKHLRITAPIGVLIVLALVAALGLILFRVISSRSPREGKSVILNVEKEVPLDRNDTNGYFGAKFAQKPFLVFWNAPSELCRRYGILINVSQYGVVQNENDDFRGQNIAVFYEKDLGKYPHYSSENTPVNGGLPMNASLYGHLIRMREDLMKLDHTRSWSGPTVIDWEHWHPPLWEYQWGTRRINRQRSMDLIRRRHPELDEKKIEKRAIEAFEYSTRKWMIESLREGQRVLPNSLWGFYWFPYCSSFSSQLTPEGHCGGTIQELNDRLSWIVEESRALYPRIYIDYRESDIPLFVRAQIGEAQRLLNQTRLRRPVVAYATFYIIIDHNKQQYKFMSLDELDQSIGEAVRAGADAIVVWSTYHLTNSREECITLQNYVSRLLGPYLRNLIQNAEVCSADMCNGQGRCVVNSNQLECHCFEPFEGTRCDSRATRA